MAEKSSELQSLSCTLKELSEDEKVKLRCEARERYYADREAAVNGGIQTGNRTGLTNGLKLSRLLIEHGRISDIERCETDEDFRQQILKEFHLI